ncbi:MAG TPA: hypothetical protein VE988_04915 [Gemmataceae bacterium]|nr:hypothetical protein [Gemmataceae bacterium]
MHLSRIIAVLALTALLAPSATAQSPRDDLVRLVPDDVAMCLVVHDLRGQGDKLLKSPWAKALNESAFGKVLGDAPELLKLEEVQKQLAKRLHIEWDKLRDDILGDALVFAYRPGPPGQPEKEQGIFLLHARDPALLTKLFERLNELQTKSGELKGLKQHQHKGFKYTQRLESGHSQFFVVDGNFLAFTGQEEMLRKVLDRRADAKLPPLPLVKHLKDAGCDKALASVWINPRAFEPLLQAQAKELGETPEGKSLKTFLGYWKALDGITLSLDVAKGPAVVLGVHAQIDLLPPAARKVALESANKSELWSRFPADSIMTLAVRTDFEALIETFDQLMPGQAETGLAELLQKSLGVPLSKEFLKELAPHIGPDVGFCVAGNPVKDEFPHILFALRIRPKPDEPGFDKSLVTALQFLAAAGVGDYNRKHKDQIQFKTLKQDGVEVKYLVNDEKFPKGFQPAFAAKEGYLVLGSSPEALKRFAAGASAVPSATQDSPLLRLSFPKLSRLIKDRRDVLLNFLTEQRQLSKQEAEGRYKALTWGLSLFERAELVQRTTGNHVAWVFRLQTVD